MTKNEVIKRLCKLSSEVGEHKHHRHAHDCFCEDAAFDTFNFSEDVMKFIEEAVEEKIKNSIDLIHS